MNKDWEIKDLGPISRYLGMKFTEDSRHVYIDQAPYLRALLESFGMGECNQLSTPEVEVPLPREEDNSPLLNETEQSNYRSLVGRLLWACLCTRPDLQFAVSRLSSKVAYPTEGDMKLLKKCLRYIKGTLDCRLVERRTQELKWNWSVIQMLVMEMRRSERAKMDISFCGMEPHLMELQKAEVRINLHPSSRSLWTQ